jgi:MoaA/NifB/PqqE/SkfB family radical SAM enzyme
VLAWDHWHIEPSSICPLRCPRCPRAEVPESLLNRQLTLEFFQNQIGADIISNIKKITFCGNDGDPIYCREFLEICQWIKHVNAEIHLVIITNGSHKTNQWWQILAGVLDHRDEIHWSIDGWDKVSNEQYRVNSNWVSTMAGIKTFTAINQDTYRVWATIAFRFNQANLVGIRELARSMGMDAWQMTKSTKFGSHYPEVYGNNDDLCPEFTDLVSASHRFEREFTDLTHKDRPSDVLKTMFWQRAQHLDQQQQHAGICLIGNKGVFLNSQGEFYPCCWTANRYSHNQEWHDRARSQFNLWQTKFLDIINDKFWNGDFLEFNSLECSTKCTMDKLKDLEHTTAW